MRRRTFITEENYSNESEAPTRDEPNGPETVNGIIYGSRHVNLRKEASMESEIITILKDGTNVKIMGFYKISCMASKTPLTGYVFSKYCKEV